MVAGTIAVRRSYDADTTKGGHADLIPIAAGLRPFLAEAMLSARGEYVFPDREGKMRSRQTKLRTVLARALKRAGLVAGYTHVCRRKGCGHREETKDRPSALLEGSCPAASCVRGSPWRTRPPSPTARARHPKPSPAP